MGASVPWFPVVGAGIGAVSGAIAAGLLHVTTPLIAGALAVGATLLLTGAFHHDGLADIADAFPGAMTVDRRLEILKDSRLGTFGVAALTVALVTQISAIASFGPRHAFVILIASHAVARSAAVMLMASVKPARSSGLGVDYLAELTRVRAIVAMLAGPVIAIVVLGWSGLMVSAAAFAAAAIVGWLSVNKVGGIVGDALGGAEQVAEVTVLVVATILIRQGVDVGLLL